MNRGRDGNHRSAHPSVGAGAPPRPASSPTAGRVTAHTYTDLQADVDLICIAFGDET